MMLITKTCCSCKIAKDPADFNSNKTRADGLQGYCRECSHKRFKHYYDTHKKYHREQVVLNKRKTKGLQREYLWNYLLEHPCIDCGESDPVVLEFDHVRGDKHMEVTKMVSQGYGWGTIELEIDKCDVRCVKCHKKITFERAGAWRSKW